jgi:hypothetical protein
LPIVQDSCRVKIDKQILSRFPCCLRREGIPWLKHSEFPKAIAGVAVKPVLYPFTGSITGVVTGLYKMIKPKNVATGVVRNIFAFYMDHFFLGVPLHIRVDI